MKINQFKQDSPLTIAKPEELRENIEIEGVKISKLNQNLKNFPCKFFCEFSLNSFHHFLHKNIPSTYNLKFDPFPHLLNYENIGN